MNKILQEIQFKVGAEPDGQFGPDTAFAIGKYLKFNIFEASHFLGQAYEETGGLTRFVENPNYGAEFLHKNFSAFKDKLVAMAYAHQPEKIANRAYANRGGNGNEASGDGWKFRGRGMFQTTFQVGYTLVASEIGDPRILTSPDVLAEEYALESAVNHWKKNKISTFCTDITKESVTNVTRKINGPGLVNLDKRIRYTTKMYNWLKDLNY